MRQSNLRICLGGQIKMKIVMNIWGFFQTNILTQPAFFIGR